MATSSDGSEIPAISDAATSATPPIIAYQQSLFPSPAVVVCCRLLAIALVAPGIERLIYLILGVGGWLFGTSNARYEFFEILAGGIGPLIWLLTAVFCWWQAPRLAVQLLRDVPHDPADHIFRALPGNELLAVFLIALGAYQLSDAIPALIQGLMHAASKGSMTGASPYLVAPVTRAVIGIYLIIGHYGIMRFIRQIRRAMARRTGYKSSRRCAGWKSTNLKTKRTQQSHHD